MAGEEDKPTTHRTTIKAPLILPVDETEDSPPVEPVSEQEEEAQEAGVPGEGPQEADLPQQVGPQEADLPQQVGPQEADLPQQEEQRPAEEAKLGKYYDETVSQILQIIGPHY